MKVVGLLSGGKDSCFNLLHCLVHGHEIAAIANLKPAPPYDELDSFMYQTVGHDAIEAIAKCLQLPLFRRTIVGGSVSKGRDYTPQVEQTKDKDEVEDLFELLKDVVTALPRIDAVAVGAILSDYQRVRVENVCSRLGLTVLAYLWQEDQERLLRSMFECELDAVVIKVAAMGLDPKKHLGKHLNELFPLLLKLHEQFDVHVAGEGGEYETLTVDCPLFKQRLVFTEVQPTIHSADAFAPVGYLKINKIEFIDKPSSMVLPPHMLIDERDQGGGVRLRDNAVCDLINLRCSVNRHLESFEEFQFAHNHVNLPPGDKNIPTRNLPSYSPGIVVEEGPYFTVVGLTTKNVSKTNVTQETQDLLNSLKLKLAEHDLNLDDVCQVSLWISCMSDFGAINKVYVKFFGLNPPSRTTVGQKTREGSITLDCIAIKNARQIKEVIHVQGISNWAPANIGPYSQAVRFGPLVLLAGQIPLIPGQMKLPSSEESDLSCSLSLSHVLNVLKRWHLGWRDLMQGIAFVTSAGSIPKIRSLWEAIWNHQQLKWQVPLLIVQVEDLPRNASIEWAFSAVDEASIQKAEKDAEDNDEADVSPSPPKSDRHLSFMLANLDAQAHLLQCGKFLFASVLCVPNQTSSLDADAISDGLKESVNMICLNGLCKPLRVQVFWNASLGHDEAYNKLVQTVPVVLVQQLENNAPLAVVVLAYSVS